MPHVASPIPRLALAALAVTGAMVAAAPARAQRRPLVGVSAVTARPDHYLARRMSGLEARADLPIGTGRWSLRFGFEHLRGEQDRMGSTCVGLVEIDADCSPKPLRDETRLRTAHAGLGLLVLGGRRLAASVVGLARLGRVDASSRYAPASETDDGSLDAGKSLYGLEGGAELTWTPAHRYPFALVGGATVGFLEPRRRIVVADGYTPFQDGLEARRAYLGLAVVWPAR